MTRSPIFAPSARYRFASSARLVASALFILALSHGCNAAYYGKLLGKLSEFHHGVSGEVYAVDGRTLYIKDFTYDGEGPAAFFYAGNSKTPNGNGFRIRDERGTTEVLSRYRKKDITLTLPEGKTLSSIKWFSVYCDEFAVNFGDVRIPRGFDYPRPQKLAPLNGVHGVSSEPVVVVDAQTLLIPGFSYDGEAPDAKFWVGPGPNPSPQGIRIPDENGRSEPLRRYERKTIVLTLPGDLTVHQLGHFGVWCEAFTVDFGHIKMPATLNVPPSLKMLGVSPQSKLNCEVLEDRLALEVRWAVAGDSIVVQLVGKLDAGQYMSFGLSPNPERSRMVGGDVAVAWVDQRTLQGYAVDYFLEAKSQCSGGRGSCPDTRIRDNTNSVRLLNAAMVNGYSIVTYQRPLKGSDELDLHFRTNTSQAIIWAVGPLNERKEVSFHSDYLKTDRFIEFGRPPAWNCPLPDEDMPHPPHVDNAEKENKQELVATTRRPQRPVPTPASAPRKDAWVIPPIQCDEPDDGVFFAQMGPTGGKHGYPAITGHVGWGISWYINGLLIPEINVVRGKKYTFVTEGGEDPDIPARYHPFYITDDPVGGYEHKTPEERSKVKIFAGVRRQRGITQPTGVGRLCNWLPDEDQPPADEFDSFGAYQRTLTLKCDNGDPGFVEWTPDANTPDVVYYQCFTHRYLGWKINVVDSCDVSQGAASETHAVYAKPDNVQKPDSDSAISSNIRITSKVTPAPDLFHHQRHYHPQEKQAMHYQLHQSNHHYKTVPNKNLAMNHAGKLVITIPHSNNININNINNKKKYTAQLTPNHGKGIRGIEMRYEQRNPYELTKQSYEEMMQTLPERSLPYRPTDPMHHQQQQQMLHHHPHHRHHFSPTFHHEYDAIRAHGHLEGGLNALMRPQLRPQSAQASNVAAYYREIKGGMEGESPGGWFQVTAGPATNSASGNRAIIDQHSKNLDQEIHQSAPVPASIIASPNKLSHLIPDKRPIMSYGQMKFAYPHPGSAQYVYSRPGQISQQIPKTTQLMILRRPMIQPTVQTQSLRRPFPASMMMANNAGEQLVSSSRPIVMERKKATYADQPLKTSGPIGQRDTQFFKFDNKKSSKQIEAKISTEMSAASIAEQNTGQTRAIEPAKNKGFDPDSIIIESGFKPIVRNVNRDGTNAEGRQQFFQNMKNYRMDDAATSAENQTVSDYFEPIFVPSPLDRDNALKKQRNTIMMGRSSNRQKIKLDDVDDMEMAADRLESYYLPPPGSGIATINVGDRIGAADSGTLIAYDGKRITDPSLAQSKPSAEVKRSRSRLTSEVLSKTPQFGKFRGALPPPIPANIMMESVPQFALGRVRNKSRGTPRTDFTSTKLTPYGIRAKRSAPLPPVKPIVDTSEHRNSSGIDRPPSYVSQSGSMQESTLSSTGQMLITNIQYVFLTIILYFAM